MKIRSVPGLNLLGKGALICMIDTGIDYTNPVFIKEDATTKIVSLWDQTIQSETGYPDRSFYGTEYKAEQINEALKSERPLDIVPSRDEDGHGTMMAAIAAGNIVRKEKFSGVAPGVDYLAPNLDQGYSFYTGTGAAAAHTAGVVALLFEWGVTQGRQENLSTFNRKQFLIRGAKRSENMVYPNRDWGYGILDIFGVFDVLRQER
jgi:subtilisin family serine protease